MERRHSGRIQIGFKVTVASGNSRLEGEIDDLSESGVSVLLYASPEQVELAPDTEVGLNFQATSGEIINLSCRVKWKEKKGLRTRIGMEITDPPWESSASFL